MRALKIYVAGPYSSLDSEERRSNVERAIEVSVALLRRGHFPFIPHLTRYVDEWSRAADQPLDWEDYITWDVVWLRECDALFYIASSRGADLERRIAEHFGMPIYASMDEVPQGNGLTTVHDEAQHLLGDVLGEVRAT